MRVKSCKEIFAECHESRMKTELFSNLRKTCLEWFNDALRGREYLKTERYNSFLLGQN